MKLINKLKRIIGMLPSEYTIFYTDHLSMSQTTQISQRMINKFSPNCRPNKIIVTSQTTTVELANACLTGEQLKKISDDTLATNPAKISYITLDGNKIWSK